MAETPARWPALMSEDDAAEYVGVSSAQFRKERDKGLWPKPVERGCRRNTYDRKSLDEAVDRLSGRTNPSQSANSWDVVFNEGKIAARS